MNVTIPCICPPKADGAQRHESDTVTLRDTLDSTSARAIRNLTTFVERDGVSQDLVAAETLAKMTEGYVTLGITGWSLVDAKGKPREVTRPAIHEHIMGNEDVFELVADAADDLYQAQVVLPLVKRASGSSPTSPTTDSTSAQTVSPKPPRKPSKRSSITSIPTEDTVMTSTSLVGVSRLSPSSESAA